MKGGVVIRSVMTVGWSKASSTGIGRGFLGVICPIRSSGRGRRCGNVIAGTPATVAQFLSSQLQETGCNYLVGQFAFGDLTEQFLLGVAAHFGDGPDLREDGISRSVGCSFGAVAR